MKLWSLPAMGRIRSPCGAGSRGATSSIVWVRRDDEPDEALFFGTQNGYLICWQQSRHSQLQFEEFHVFKLSSPSEITGLAFDAASSRLAACNRNSAVHLFAIDGLMKPHVIFSVIIANFLPKAIAFGHADGDSTNLLIFGLHDGQM